MKKTILVLLLTILLFQVFPEPDLGAVTLDIFGKNLLINPGAETGDMTGWDPGNFNLPGTRQNSPEPHGGNYYFFPGSGSNHYMFQEINLTDLGFTIIQLDSGRLYVAYGGWQASWPSDPRDKGQISVFFYNSSHQLLHSWLGPNSGYDGWHLNENNRTLPVGTRLIKYQFNVTRVQGSNNDGNLDDAYVVITELKEPKIQNLFPSNEEIIVSPDVLISWKTDLVSTTEIFIRDLTTGSSYNNFTGENTTNHFFLIKDLIRDHIYEYYVASESGFGLRTESEVRSFSIGAGILFSHRIYNFTVARDYDQGVYISVTNLDDGPHEMLISVISTYPDLIIGFVGDGSIDKTVTLDPLESKEIELRIHTQDAQESHYLIPLQLINLGSGVKQQPLMDYATLNITVDVGTIDFDLVEINDDPTTLIKTFNLTNYGDTVTDFEVYAIGELTSSVVWLPQIYHYRLDTNESVIFEGKLNVNWNFNGAVSGIISVKCFSEIKDFSVTYSGSGEIFYGGGDAVYTQQSSGWFCTNKPSIDLQFDMIPNLGYDGEYFGNDDEGNIIKNGDKITTEDASKHIHTEAGWIKILPASEATVGKTVKVTVGKIWAATQEAFGAPQSRYDSGGNAAIGTRGTFIEFGYNTTTEETIFKLLEGHADWYSDTLGIWRSVTINPSNNMTYEVIKEYNSTSLEYDLIFRSSSDLGEVWSSNATILSSTTLKNHSFAFLSGNLFLAYQDADTISYLTSNDDGVTWSSPTNVATGQISDVGIKTPYNKLLIYWQNNSLTKSGLYFIDSSDNGQTWSQIKKGPVTFENTLETYLEINFGLPKKKYSYRNHDIIISINSNEITRLNDTIPFGRYLFPFNPDFLHYSYNGEMVTNQIDIDTYHLNGGHYVVTTDANIIIHLNEVALPIYCQSQSEADEIVENMTDIELVHSDLGVYTNYIEIPDVIRENDIAQINCSIINLGDITHSDVTVQLFDGDPTLNGLQIGSNFTIPALSPSNIHKLSYSWLSSSSTEKIFVRIVDEDNNLKNNVAYRSVSVKGVNDIPQVKLLSTFGSIINETVFIRWNSSDSTNDPLTFSLYYGSEEIWNLITEGITSEFYYWNTSNVPNDYHYLLIAVSDGILTSNVTSTQFQVSNEITQSTTSSIPSSTSPALETTSTDESTQESKQSPGFTISIIFAYLLTITYKSRQKKKQD